MERIDRLAIMAAILGAGQDLTLQGRAEIVDEALDYEQRIRTALMMPQHAEPKPAVQSVTIGDAKLLAVLDAAQDVVNAFNPEMDNAAGAETMAGYRTARVNDLRGALDTFRGVR